MYKYFFILFFTFLFKYCFSQETKDLGYRKKIETILKYETNTKIYNCIYDNCDDYEGIRDTWQSSNISIKIKSIDSIKTNIFYNISNSQFEISVENNSAWRGRESPQNICAGIIKFNNIKKDNINLSLILISAHQDIKNNNKYKKSLISKSIVFIDKASINFNINKSIKTLTDYKEIEKYNNNKMSLIEHIDLASFLSKIDTMDDYNIYKTTEQMPQFQGGEKAMLNYINENIKYSETNWDSNFWGKIYVEFIVEKDGSISNIKILRGINENCDKELIRVIQSMPKWEPGKNKGFPVRTKLVMPVNINNN